MSDTSSARPDCVLVVCTVCRTRLHPPVGDEPGVIECPDCYTALRVPSLAEVLQKQGEQPRPEQREIGTYTLAMPVASPPPEPGPDAIVCESCGRRLNPARDDEPRVMACPHCFQPVTVPANEDAPARPRKKRRKVTDDTDEAHDSMPADDADRVPRRRRRTPFEAMADIRREEPDPPPEWVFFSDVFNFPWQPGTRGRWVLLMLACTALNITWGIAVTIFLAGTQSGNNLAIVGLGFFMLPTIWVTLWSLSYVAACCLPVITETSAGNRRIAEWPDPNWREWMGELFFILYQFLVVAMIASAVANLLRPVVPMPGLVALALGFVLLPIVLLSTMEANSPWVPVTWPVLRSLSRVTWAWGVFYGLTALMWGTFFGLLIVGFVWMPMLTALLLGPLLATLLLISARLLGRLAWRAIMEELPDEERPQPKKKRKKSRKAKTTASPASEPAAATENPHRPRTPAALMATEPHPASETKRVRKPELDDDYWDLPSLRS